MRPLRVSDVSNKDENSLPLRKVPIQFFEVSVPINYISPQLYDQFMSLESRLNRLGLMEGRTKYFSGRSVFSAIEDDHIPFMRRGNSRCPIWNTCNISSSRNSDLSALSSLPDVPVVHVIDNPFPAVWHRTTDTKENLHRPTIRNLNKIFASFLVWYLGL